MKNKVEEIVLEVGDDDTHYLHLGWAHWCLSWEAANELRRRLASVLRGVPFLALPVPPDDAALRVGWIDLDEVGDDTVVVLVAGRGGWTMNRDDAARLLEVLESQM